MGIYIKNGKYYIDYRVDGKRVRECVHSTNKRMAEKALSVRKAEIIQGRYHFKQDKGNVRLCDFAKEYLEYSEENKRKSSHIRDITLVKNLLSFFKDEKLSRITSFLIERYKMMRRETVEPATVNRELACLKNMFNLAIRWEKAETNPVRLIKFFKEPPGKMRVLSKEEEEKLLNASSEHLKPIIITALNTGMRLSEVLGLKWCNVDFNNRVITVENSKNNERRRIPMNLYLTNTLKDLKRYGEHVFCNENGEPFGAIKTGFYAALRRSGISHCTFHSFRHSFATRLVMNGADLPTVKELLGHKTIAMTMRYAHPSPEHKRKAVESLSMVENGHQMDTKQDSALEVISVSS